MRLEIAPGIRLFVDIDGFGWVPDGEQLRQRPTLLLLHGGPGFDHSAFKPLFSALTDIAQIVTWDHRGHGRSDPRPPDEWTLDTWADDVVRLCEALGIERPVVLGQSFGGFVAQRYLARYPDHAARVILSSTSAALNLHRKLPWFERLGGPEAAERARRFWTDPSDANLDDYLAHCMALYNTRPAADPQARSRARMRLDILQHFVRGEMQGMNLLPGLSRVRCPVLVLAGEQDPVCPLDDARDIAAALPAPWGRLVTVPEAGHGVWRDQPERGLQVLREFIQS